MNVVLFGASGSIGRRILAELISRGHSVTAVSRDIASLSDVPAKARKVAGDMLDAAGVAKIVAGADAVISSYAPPASEVGALVGATRSLLNGLRRAGVKRVLIVGGAGSLKVPGGGKLIDSPQFPASYKPIAEAHAQMLDMLAAEAGDLEWTNLSPPAIIEPGERTGKFRTAVDDLLLDGAGQSRITSEDYAIALVNELEKPTHIRGRFTAGY